MDYNKEYLELLNHLISESEKSGKKLTITSIAKTLGVNRPNYNLKLNKGDEFTELDLVWLKYKFGLFDEQTSSGALGQPRPLNLVDVAEALEELAEAVRELQKQHEPYLPSESGKKSSALVGQFLKKDRKANTGKSGKDQ